MAAQAGADASPGQSLQVNGDGVGPLREKTIVNAALLGKLFPDCTVSATSYEAEGETYPAFLVAKDGNRLMQIEPDRNGRLSDIIVFSPAIPGPGGAKVGDVLDAQASRCFASAEAERVLCPSSTAPNIQFVVDTRGLSIRPEQELPLTQLRGRTIVAIRWYASSEGK